MTSQRYPERAHPQLTYEASCRHRTSSILLWRLVLISVIDPESFYGKLRKIYAEKVVRTQLDRLKQQGSYDAFDLKWHPAYEVNRLKGGCVCVSDIP